MGEKEVEEWDTYDTPQRFLSSSPLCLLEGLSSCLPEAESASLCVCKPCVWPCVCASCVCAVVVSKRVGAGVGVLKSVDSAVSGMLSE